MPVNASLVKSIKSNLAGRPSGELRQMVDQRDLSRYSEEAFVAAQEVLDDRAGGRAAEPPAEAPAPHLSPAQVAALADARLRRQVRVIGVWYYVFAGAWLALLLLYARSARAEVLPAGAMVVPVALFGLLGFQLRRFSPGARGAVLFLSFLFMLNFPIGTLFGYYCYDKLTRGAHLFGVPGHPGERG